MRTGRRQSAGAKELAEDDVRVTTVLHEASGTTPPARKDAKRIARPTPQLELERVRVRFGIVGLHRVDDAKTLCHARTFLDTPTRKQTDRRKLDPKLQSRHVATVPATKRSVQRARRRLADIAVDGVPALGVASRATAALVRLTTFELVPKALPFLSIFFMSLGNGTKVPLGSKQSCASSAGARRALVAAAGALTTTRTAGASAAVLGLETRFSWRVTLLRASPNLCLDLGCVNFTAGGTIRLTARSTSARVGKSLTTLLLRSHGGGRDPSD